MDEIRTLFMGSPDFAVPTLHALCKSERYAVIGVCTQPDKPLACGLPVYQPTTLRSEEFACLLSELAPDLIVVAAYGKILPKNVLDFPLYGCVNVHASLLPAYRGADPIRRVILDGRAETGVTIMKMTEGCDTGDILHAERLPIADDDTCGSLTERLAELGASALLPVLDGYTAGKISPVPQDDALATSAPKLAYEETVVDFSRTASEITRLVRACMPAPVAETSLNGRVLKLTEVRAADALPAGEEFPPDAVNGMALAVKKGLFVKCADGAVEVVGLIPAGKKQMTGAAFVNGRQVKTGDILGR